MMFTTRDTKSHTQMCLTFIFKVNHQGQVTDFKFSEIFYLENVRIDTKIKSVACIQPEMRKVIQLICVTLSSKVNRQGHVTFFNIFDIPDLENVRIDTKIKSVACIQPEMRKVTQLICDLEFQGQPSRSRDFSSTYLISPTSKMLESTPRSTSYHFYFVNIIITDWGPVGPQISYNVSFYTLSVEG